MTQLEMNRTAAQPPVVSFEELNSRPHDVFRTYRGDYPVIQRDDGVFFVLRARDVEALVADPRTRQVATELLAARGLTSGPVVDFLANTMLFADGAVHRRRRKPLSRLFAYRMMADLRPRIRELAEDLLKEPLRNGTLRVGEEYASLVPSITIAAILGIPRSDVPHFTKIAYDVAKSLTTSWTMEDVPGIEAATDELLSYTENLIEERRRSPKDDFLSTYVRNVDDAHELSAIEAINQIAGIIIGGSDTTRAAIVIQTALLAERPSVWEAVCQDSDLAAPAVMECLRFEPPVASFTRFTLADIEIDGYLIPKGRPLVMSSLSAMRDPAVYDDPDEFDIMRTQVRWHPVFGGGAHRCLGEALARIELEEALLALAASGKRLELAGEPLRVQGHGGIRRVDELEVRFV